MSYAISVYFGFYQFCCCLPRRHCCARRDMRTIGRRRLGCTPTRSAERQRIIGAEASRIAMLTRQRRAHGSTIGQALQFFELLACNEKRLSFGRASPVFFLGKENGGRITCSACGAAIPPQRCRAAKHAILHTFHRAVNNNSASFIWKETVSIWKSEKRCGARCRL